MSFGHIFHFFFSPRWPRFNSYGYDRKCTSWSLIGCYGLLGSIKSDSELLVALSIFSLNSNIFLISLLATFAVWGCVGHSKVLNCWLSDKLSNVGKSVDNSSKADFLTPSNLLQVTRKCCSSSTGPGTGGPVHGGVAGVLGGAQYTQALRCKGVTGLVQRPLSTWRKWLPVLSREIKLFWFRFLTKSM